MSSSTGPPSSPGKRSDGTIDVLGYYTSWMQLNMSIFGGSFYDEQTDAVQLDNKQNLDTLNYIVRYTKAYDPKKLADYQQVTSGAAQGTLDPILAGRTAMILEGPLATGGDQGDQAGLPLRGGPHGHRPRAPAGLVDLRGTSPASSATPSSGAGARATSPSSPASGGRRSTPPFT